MPENTISKANRPHYNEILSLIRANNIAKLKQKLEGFTTLNLMNADLRDTEAEIIAKALIENNTVKKLILSYNRITNEGAKFLFRNNLFTELDLEQNLLTDEVLEDLIQNNSIIKLSLKNNAITNRGAVILAQNKTIAELNLHSNQIADEGAEALATNNTRIRSLILSYNKICDKGAIALSQSKTIIKLDLIGNKMTDTGIASFATNNVLNYFSFWGNNYSEKIKQLLLENNTITETNPCEAEWFEAKVSTNKRFINSMLDKLIGVISPKTISAPYLPITLYQAIEYLKIPTDKLAERLIYRAGERSIDLDNTQLNKFSDLISKTTLDNNFMPVISVSKDNVLPGLNKYITSHIASYVKPNEIFRQKNEVNQENLSFEERENKRQKVNDYGKCERTI